MDDSRRRIPYRCITCGSATVGILLPTVIALLTAASVFGQSAKIWVPAGSGNWFVNSNWSPLGVPGSSSISQISNGGTANADSGVNNVVSNRIEVGKNGGTGTLNVVGRTVTLGSDFDIGQIGSDFATGSITVNGNGTATISNSTSVRIGTLGTGHIDVGHTGAGSGATATAIGNFTIDAATLVDVKDDFNVGQTNTTATNATANGNGTVNITNIGTLSMGGDLDIGSSGGSGRSTATGSATIRTITNPITIGLSLVVGRTTGSTTSAGNSGHGTVTMSDASVNVGFADAGNPGSLDIGDVIASGEQLGNAYGLTTLERVTLNVKDRINIGELSGGGTNAASTTDGTLALVDSLVTTPELDIARVLSTAGTARGKLSLNPSLLNVNGPMSLGAGSELVFALAGTTRATGTSGPGQYSAINATTAAFNGKLTIQLAGGFTPAAGNQFQVISTSTATGAFGSIVLPTLPAGLAWGVNTTSTGVLLSVNSGSLPGDFNGDGKVDAADYVRWRKTNGSAAAYNTWRANYGRVSGFGAGAVQAAAAPEPTTILLLTFGFVIALVRARPIRFRPAARHCR
jgi:hypothetical protein